MDKTEQLSHALRNAKRITVLTGAGISTASGIPDFRSRGGLYDKEPDIEYILSENFFKRDPKQFWMAYKRIFQLENFHLYEPNASHYFLADLERLGKQVTIITQNVDDLHRQAGSTCVLEVHGTLHKAHCPICHQTYGLRHLTETEYPHCDSHHGLLKPNVVLFGGRVMCMEEAYSATCDTDVFMALGTSLKVYPVNELPTYIRHAANITKAIINQEPTLLDSHFDHVFHEELIGVFDRIRKLLHM